MNRHLPPGPLNFNATFGLTWRHYWKLRTNPIGFATELTRQYGDVVFFRIFWHRAILVNHPDLIRDVLVTRSDDFPKHDRIRHFLRQLTGDGLLVTEGDIWRQQRLDTQKILRSSRIGMFAEMTRRHTTAMLDQWKCQPVVSIEHEMTTLIQTIMGEAFFGVTLAANEPLAEAVRVISDVFHRESRALFNLPDWAPLPEKRRKLKALRLLRQTLRQVVQQRAESGERRDDFLDQLLHGQGGKPAGCPHVPDSCMENILSQLLTMYVAGFHTTSVSMAWLLFAVARDAKMQDRIRTEVNQVCGQDAPVLEHLADLKYSQMVIKESLRMYPAAWELFARKAKQDLDLGGYQIPAGSLVLIQPIVTHRDQRFFAEPDRFDPERFRPDREAEIPPFAWFPFGAGPHHCIGQSLALVQMNQIMASILQKFELNLDAGNPQSIRMVPRVSLRPKSDIRIRIQDCQGVRSRETVG